MSNSTIKAPTIANILKVKVGKPFKISGFDNAVFTIKDDGTFETEPATVSGSTVALLHAIESPYLVLHERPEIDVRCTTPCKTTWWGIHQLSQNGTLPGAYRKGDEIDIALSTGETATLVLTEVTPHGARVRFRDALDDDRCMNAVNTNKGGWAESDMRKWLNGEFFNTLPEELQEIIVPRKITTRVDGETQTVEDRVYLYSETEMFGTGDDSLQNGRTDGPDEYQLPYFKEPRNRVAQQHGKPYTRFHWLRSAYYVYGAAFCVVGASGGADCSGAYLSRALAPGFDIG